jgi:hypothetical protein
MKWGSMDTIIVDVQDIKAKSSLKQDRAGFFLRKSSRNLLLDHIKEAKTPELNINKVVKEIS